MPAEEASTAAPPQSLRSRVWELLEARTAEGHAAVASQGHGAALSRFEAFLVGVIGLNVIGFVAGSIFNRDYNVDPDKKQYLGPSCDWCDAAFIGNDRQNGLRGTSALELFTVAVFTVEYLLRFWSCVEEGRSAKDCRGWPRLRFALSFYGLVDLVCIVPTYITLLLPVNLPALQFMRMFRLFRVLAAPGRYGEAFTLLDDVFIQNSRLLAVSSYVGIAVWVCAATLYYLVERGNPATIYCPSCPDVDAPKCEMDDWGFVDCSNAGCPRSAPCWNLFESIPSSMFFSLLNLFGEYPLSDRHSAWGMVVGASIQAVAVFVFSIPTGILGNGFSQILKARRAQRGQAEQEEAQRLTREAESSSAMGISLQEPVGVGQPEASSDRAERAAPLMPGSGEVMLRERRFAAIIYKVLHGDAFLSRLVQGIIDFLIVTSIVSFMLETCNFCNNNTPCFAWLRTWEVSTLLVFTAEYLLRFYSAGEEPSFVGAQGRVRFVTSLDSLIDLAAILPGLLGLIFGFGLQQAVIVRALRLIRLFKVPQTKLAFSVLQQVLRQQSDVLAMTGFAALVCWLFFSTLMYYAERANPDASMSSYYRSIPDAMWVTLLNLSGEAPICFFTAWGKLVIGVIGIFAVGFVGIPIGVLGAGFQDWVEEHEEDTPDVPSPVQQSSPAGSRCQRISQVLDSSWFGIFVFLLIAATMALGIIETLPGLTCQSGTVSRACSIFSWVEASAVILFTIEYLLRLLVAPSIFRYVCSFYSLVDLLAILPWYVALCLPGGWVDRHNTMFLLFRVLRVLKLDAYVHSLTLLDDVFRLKRQPLAITGLVALTLWILFDSLLYLAEHADSSNAIDPIPLQGCSVNCTEAERFSNSFASLHYTMVHLTGDYPIIDYSWAGRGVCFLMVIVGVGIVSIPSGLVADGLVQVVKINYGERSALRAYDRELLRLGYEAPREFRSERLDRWQTWLNELVNGSPYSGATRRVRGPVATAFSSFILVLIISNIAAVLLESVPQIDRAVGNGAWNFFDVFEAVSVLVFTAEYVLRLFSVTKDRKHLYSRKCYITSFFGVADLLAILPWYVQEILSQSSSSACTFRILRVFRLFRILELEHFLTAFTVLDNVFCRASPILLSTGLLAMVIWICSATLFYMFEQGNPNFCQAWEDATCGERWTANCVCTSQGAFATMPSSLYYTAIFLGGEWALIDFSVPGRILCVFLCVLAIGIYAIPIGTLFESFGAVLEGGLEALEEEEEQEQQVA